MEPNYIENNSLGPKWSLMDWIELTMLVYLHFSLCLPPHSRGYMVGEPYSWSGILHTVHQGAS